jgi:hypothetical protein
MYLGPTMPSSGMSQPFSTNGRLVYLVVRLTALRSNRPSSNIGASPATTLIDVSLQMQNTRRRPL